MLRQFRCYLLMIEDEQQQCQGSDTTMNEIGERIAAFLREPASDDIAGGGTDALTVMTAPRPTLKRPEPDRIRSAAIGVAMPIKPAPMPSRICTG